MNYKFVDLTRFFSMISIVFCHSVGAFTFLSSSSFNTSFFWILIPMKFGTICFYLISGFLLGEKITDTPSLTYLKRRFNNTFQPYLIALVCYVLFNSMSYLFGSIRAQSIQEYGLNLIHDFFNFMFFTNYWFIINYFISLIIILLFKKYLFTYAFPIITLLITIIYSLNIYVEYFEPRHGAALFGFIFYLWLGIFINKYKKKIIIFIDKISLSIILVFSGLLLMLNIYEAFILQAINSIDPLNTLKISNQLYSLIIFVLFIKVRNLELPGVFNPKKDTYGIYLYHPFLLLILYKAITFFTGSPILNTEYLIPVSFLSFLIIYSITLLVVKCINNPPSKWSEEFKILLNIQRV